MKGEHIKRLQLGFTLVETLCGIVILGIMSPLLIQCFNTVYANAMYLQKASYNMNHARVVNVFIKDKIREAYKVSIDIKQEDKKGELINYVKLQPPIQKWTEEVLEGELIRIILQDEAGKVMRIEMAPNVLTGTHQSPKGKYQLNYISNGVSSLISDQIESIKVSKPKYSDGILFKGTYVEAPSVNRKREQVEDLFFISLAYKLPIL